tara:strand:- start:286 stop:474 length:189 start_codon:yes stop_codon:yes gene_type:complete
MEYIKSQFVYALKNPMEAGIGVSLWIFGAAIGIFFIMLSLDLFKHVVLGTPTYFEKHHIEQK